MSAKWLTLNALKSGRSGHLPADSPLDRQASKGLTGRGERTRTSDLVVPNDARYLLRHAPTEGPPS